MAERGAIAPHLLPFYLLLALLIGRTLASGESAPL
jgi:hypothetical protein